MRVLVSVDIGSSTFTVEWNSGTLDSPRTKDSRSKNSTAKAVCDQEVLEAELSHPASTSAGRELERSMTLKQAAGGV
jgi:hypothetical protein